MKRFHFSLILFCSLTIPSMLYALSVIKIIELPTDPAQHVSEWTEHTLLTTLTAGFHDDVSEAANVRKRYLAEAWAPMAAFMDAKIVLVKNRQAVKFRPKPIIPATILAPEDCEGASCWRVHQSFVVPELRNRLDFTAVVATADPAHGSPYVIQSLIIGVINY
jgi:hypothetical protein